MERARAIKDYDMEGILAGKYPDVAKSCKDLRSAYGKDIKCQATCLGGDVPSAASVKDAL